MSHQLWSTCLKYRISPNQIYYLDSRRDQISTGSIIDADIERAIAQSNGYVDSDNNLTAKALVVLNEFETYLVKRKKKISKEILGDDFADRIKEYLQLFPDGKLPSGQLAKVNTKTLTDKFIKFFDMFPDYNNWPLILEATNYYIYSCSKEDNKFMQTSEYFISKQNLHKEISSKLADYCQMILNDPELKNIQD
jgi:hypothetical protein